VFLALGVIAVGDDLAVAVDPGRVVEREAGAGRDQIVEVPQCSAAMDHAAADDHAIVVDRCREEVEAKIGHLAAAPEEAVVRVRAGLGRANHLAVVVDGGAGTTYTPVWTRGTANAARIGGLNTVPAE